MRRLLPLILAPALGATLVASPAGAMSDYSSVFASGPLSDLSGADNATDGADARLYAFARGDGTTTFILVVVGLDPAAEGETFGTHVHSGPCVPGNGAAAGPHYNTEGPGGTPDAEHEVWLDFTVRPGVIAVSRADVPFVIPDGDAQSIVIHALPTEEGTGAAGARLACLPVEF